MNPQNIARLMMVTLAIVIHVALVLLSELREPEIWDVVGYGLVGFIAIEIAFYLNDKFRLSTKKFLYLLLLLIGMAGQFLSGFFLLVRIPSLLLIEPPIIITVFLRGTTSMTAYKLTEYVLLTITLFVVVKLTEITLRSPKKELSLSIPYGKPESNPKLSQVTRYLSATMLLDPVFRREVLDFVKDKHRAFAPELGIDLTKLVNLGYLLEARQRHYDIYYSFALLASFLFAQIDPNISLIILLTSSVSITFYNYYEDKFKLIPLVTEQKYDPEHLEQAVKTRFFRGKVRHNLPDTTQNLLIYSGFYPFSGAGFQSDKTEGWSFPINICRSTEFIGQSKPIKQFHLKELYDFVVHAISKCNFKGFEAKDFLFINGLQVHDIPWILSDNTSVPPLRIPHKYINQYTALSDQRIRYYKWLQFFDWDNELVVSYIIRFSNIEEYLFVEVNRFLLTPLRDSFRGIDKKNTSGIFTLIGVGLESVFWGLPTMLEGAFKTIHNLLYLGYVSIAEWLETQFSETLVNSRVVFGASVSLRECVSDPNFNHYFQKLDKEMYFKVIEKQILEALSQFLENHNIDTSDLKVRQTTILNNGLIVQGHGKVEAQSIAVGKASQSIVEVTRTDTVQ